MEGIDLLIDYFCNNCPICCTLYQSLKLTKNPRIITDESPHYRYLCDITFLDKKITGETKYNYIIDFLDHFSKFYWAFPIEQKNAETSLKYIKIFFMINVLLNFYKLTMEGNLLIIYYQVI